MNKLPALILMTVCLLSVVLSCVEYMMNVDGKEISESTWGIWAFVYIILVGSWVLRDTRASEVEKPFDFGLFLYLLLPVALLYYLVSSRGGEGVITYIGFAALYFMPEFFGLVAYAYVY